MRALVLILSLFAAAKTVEAQAAADPSAVVTVTGTGEVAAEPDMAVLTLGVTQRAGDAEEAMERVSETMAEVIGALDAQGLPEGDTRTARLSLYPLLSDEGMQGPPRVTGFEASNQLRVEIFDLAVLGAVLDAALDEGATDMSGLSFALSDPRAATDEARRRAVADARAKAALYAEAAGLRLGAIRSIAEPGGASGAQPMMMAEARSGAAIRPGELTVSAGITIVWTLEDTE